MFLAVVVVLVELVKLIKWNLLKITYCPRNIIKSFDSKLIINISITHVFGVHLHKLHNWTSLKYMYFLPCIYSLFNMGIGEMGNVSLSGAGWGYFFKISRSFASLHFQASSYQKSKQLEYWKSFYLWTRITDLAIARSSSSRADSGLRVAFKCLNV